MLAPLIVRAVSYIYGVDIDDAENYYPYRILIHECYLYTMGYQWDDQKVLAIINGENRDMYKTWFKSIPGGWSDIPYINTELIISEASIRDEQHSILTYLNDNSPDHVLYVNEPQFRYLISKICSTIRYLQHKDKTWSDKLIEDLRLWLKSTSVILSKGIIAQQRALWLMDIIQLICSTDVITVKNFLLDNNNKKYTSHPELNKIMKFNTDHVQSIFNMEVSRDRYQTGPAWIKSCLIRQMIRQYKTNIRPFSYILYLWAMNELIKINSVRDMEYIADMLNYNFIDDSVFSSVQIQGWFPDIEILPDYLIGKYEKISIEIPVQEHNNFLLDCDVGNYYNTLTMIMNGQSISHFLSNSFIHLFKNIVDVYNDKNKIILRSKGWELLNNYTENSPYYKLFYQQVDRYRHWEYEFLLLCHAMEIKGLI